MRFYYPIFLVFAALVPIVGLFWSFLRARRAKALTRITLKVPEAPAAGVQMACVLLGLFFVLLAAARPQWGRTRHVSRSRNVVIAIDVSRSMLAEDVRPNRLERAKADVADLIDSLKEDRCALVAFRRTGVLLCPLTTDRAFLRSTLESLTPESAPRGETDLGSAIREALAALDPAADAHNAIIVISDGGDLREEALKNAALAKSRGIPIFTVGIGNPRVAATLPAENGRGVQMFKGQPVTVKLESETLEKIAAASAGGCYVPLATTGMADTTLGDIYRKYLRNVAIKEQNEEETSLGERYQIPLGVGLVFLLVGAALSRGRFASGQRGI